MVFVRRINQEEAPSEEEIAEQPTRGLLARRQLAHHYILEPIGKPQNYTGTEEGTGVVHDHINVMPPPKTIVMEEHEQEKDTEEGGDADDEAQQGDQDTAEPDNGNGDEEFEFEIFDDHDSGEEKVAAMIAEMQSRAPDGGDPTDEEKDATEDLVDEEGEDGDTEGTEDDNDEDEAAPEDLPDETLVLDTNITQTLEPLAALVPANEDGSDVGTATETPEATTNEENQGKDENAIGKAVQEDLPDETPVDDTNVLQTLEPLATLEPANEDDTDIGTATETPEPTTNEENATDEDVLEDLPDEVPVDDTSVPQTLEPSATLEPANVDDSDSGTATETTEATTNEEYQDTEPENDEDTPGDEDTADGDAPAEGGANDDTSGQDTLEPPNTEQPAEEEEEEEESSTSPTATPSSMSSEQNVVVTASPSPAPSVVATASPSPAPSVVATASPSPAPSSVTSEAQIMPSIIDHPDALPPNSGGPTEPADSPIAAPSGTSQNTEKENHDDAPEPKSHETQPHSDTSGTTDSSSLSFGALCRHPTGDVQKFNCKVVAGVQSHPLAFSAAFFVVFIWACCLCRRMCKGRRRRDDHGEYREVAAQYDDMLFQGTFDDNYSASFGDDHSAGGSISSDEEDDWTKGPNIEMGNFSHKEDNLTLEEMNG